MKFAFAHLQITNKYIIYPHYIAFQLKIIKKLKFLLYHHNSNKHFPIFKIMINLDIYFHHLIY